MGTRGKPVSYFFLNHHRYVDDLITVIDKSLQQWGCDIVWEVRDDVKGNPGESSFQRVTFNDFNIRRYTASQPGNQLSIDFDCNHTMSCSSEHERQGAATRTDFQDCIFRSQARELDDAPKDRRIA